MDIDVFAPEELTLVFRTLRTALNPGPALTEREREFLATYALIARHAPPDDLRPIDAGEVRVATPHRAKRLVQLAALAVLLSRPVREASVAYVEALARCLDAHDPVVGALRALQRGRLRQVRFMSMRRMMRVMLKEAYLREGPAGVWRLFGAMLLKFSVNRATLWQYKRLGLMPEGTLGREYWKFMTREGFGFPGEPAGIVASVSYHDVAHVLAGHPATPIGEIQQGCFQGGNRREDGFVFVQFAVLHFHQGVPITPATPAMRDLFEPAKVLWAIHRGARCNVDMTHQWNYWPLMPMPLAQARAACELLPRQPSIVH
jgi:hypothetical protein